MTCSVSTLQRAGLVALAMFLGLPQSASAQEPAEAPCVVDTHTGPHADHARFALGGVVFTGENYLTGENKLFLARTLNGGIAIDQIKTPDDNKLGLLNPTHDIGDGILIRGYKRLFLARVIDGAIVLTPASNADIGFVDGVFNDLPDGSVLVRAQSGLYLEKLVNGELTVKHISNDRPLSAIEIPGAGILMRIENGWLLAHLAADGVALDPVHGPDTGSLIIPLRALPDGSTVIRSTVINSATIRSKEGIQESYFLAHRVNGGIAIDALSNNDTGRVSETPRISTAGAVMLAENGWFLAHLTNDTLAIDPLATAATGGVLNVIDFPDVGILIQAEKGWFVTRIMGGAVVVDPLGDVDTGSVGTTTIGLATQLEFPQAVVLGGDNGPFLAHIANGKAVIDRGTTPKPDSARIFFPGDIGVVVAPQGLMLVRAESGTVTLDHDIGSSVELTHDFPSHGVLLASNDGPILAHAVDGKLALDQLIPDRIGAMGTRQVYALHHFADGALIGGNEGLFLARVLNEKVVVDPIGKVDTGTVIQMFDFPGNGVLISAAKGWFLARLINGETVISPVGNAPSISPRVWNVPGGGGVLIGSERGMVALSKAPAPRADCIAQ